MSSTHSYYQMTLASGGYSPLAAPKHPEDSSKLSTHIEQEIRKTRKFIRTVRLLSRTGSAIFNSIMFAIMAFVTSVFLSTRLDKVDGRNVWPAESNTWPTYMLLTASLVTLVVEISVLCFYWFRFSRAETSWKLVLVENLVHFSMWLVVTFLYRYEKRLKDVWGWSCSDVGMVIQKDLNGPVNFEKLCGLQEVSWIFSTIQTAAKVLLAILYFILFRRSKAAKSKLRLADGFSEGVGQILGAAI